MNTLVVIPARGGSKGLPGKNIKLLNCKPLIHYTIEAAREVFDDSCIYVSTDSKQIKSVVEDTGLKVPFLRPYELATDTANSQDVIKHAVKFYEKSNNVTLDLVVLLQPTSPLRTAYHIKEALKLYNKELDMVVSVKETSSNPYYVLYEESNQGFLTKSKDGNYLRRQDCPKVWEYNGAIYIINRHSLMEKEIICFLKVIKYVMDPLTSLDIDSQLDFDFIEFIKNK